MPMHSRSNVDFRCLSIRVVRIARAVPTGDSLSFNDFVGADIDRCKR